MNIFRVQAARKGTKVLVLLIDSGGNLHQLQVYNLKVFPRKLPRLEYFHIPGVAFRK